MRRTSRYVSAAHRSAPRIWGFLSRLRIFHHTGRVNGIAVSFLIFWGSVALSGCGAKPEPRQEISQAPRVKEDKPTSSASVIDPQTAATITGTIFFKGSPPVRAPIRMEGNPECKGIHSATALAEDLIVQEGRLQNAFVYVKEGLEGYTFQPPNASVKIDQSHCIFVPHVTGVQVGQPLVLVNSDPTLHNVHATPKHSVAWNLGFPSQGMERTKKILQPEVMVPIKCDVHPWMQAYVGVLAHPFFAVTGADGRFELKGLPPGTYVIEVWHEKLGTQTQTISLGPAEKKEMSFAF